MVDLKSPHCTMGKRNYKKLPKYRRKRARLLGVGELFGDTSPNIPLVPTEQTCVPVPPTDIGSRSQETEPEIEAPQKAFYKTPYKTTLEDDTVENEEQELSETDFNVLVDDDEIESASLTADNMTDVLDAGDNVHLGMDLLTVCTETKVPLETYDKILRIFKKYCPGHTDPQWWNSIPTREKLMKILRSKVPTVNPTLHQVTNDPMDIVTKYPFLSQLMDLFSNPQFQEVDSCCVNTDKHTRFLKYRPTKDEGISDLVCAKWYSDTYDLRIGNQPTYQDPVSNQVYHNWLVPLKFYNDKTGVTAMEGAYSLEPLMFTVCVLRCHVLQSEHSWRHLGFIPSKAVKSRNGEESLVFTHQCLSILLGDLTHLQQNPPLLTLHLFGEIHRVRLILEVACVLGDQVSQDAHCCRKQSNAGGAGRVHRSCLASFIKADHPPPEGGCTPVSKRMIEDLCETVWSHEDLELREASLSTLNGEARTKMAKLMDIRSKVARDILGSVLTTYPVKNAWSHISFGSNVNGIYRATLDDPMHYHSSGLFSYLGEIAFKCLLPSEAKMVEQYLREDASARSSNQCNLPKGKFHSGFTNCTLLTASEKVGVIHTLYYSLGTKRVADIYQVAILRQQQKYMNMKCFHQVRSEQHDSEKKSNDVIPARLLGDKYFFKAGPTVNKESVPMEREPQDVLDMLQRLNRIGMLKVVSDIIPHFDDLQTEYLLQIVWDRLSQKNLNEFVDSHVSRTETIKAQPLRRLSIYLSKRLTKPHVLPRSLSHIPPIPQVIQNDIDKHCFDKPTISGNGNTTAILTDVDGFRIVLEKSLIYFACVHEFHNLPANLQQDLDDLTIKINDLIPDITESIYRGDNSTDCLTCKIHSHYHLVENIKYFGPPIGYDASTGERNLKWWAKRISTTARKCGQAMFLEQTSKRVTDHRMLKRANSNLQRGNHHTKISKHDYKWTFTRKKAHIRYNILTEALSVVEFSIPENVSPNMLLTQEIRDVLRSSHNTDEGVKPEIQIWKEIKMSTEEGQRDKYVRAFHHFDVHGSFFDWVHVKHGPRDGYVPALVLLLYRCQFDDEADKDYAVVWKCLPASNNERKHETNLSARWKMKLKDSGLPHIQTIELDDIEDCIKVHPHWRCKPKHHIPSTPILPGADKSMFVIDESYDRYSWILNHLDTDRWQ